MRDRDGFGVGVGAATAGLLAKGGARIVLNYSKSEKEAEATAETCRKGGATEVVVLRGDISRDEDCRKIVEGRRALGAVRRARQQSRCRKTRAAPRSRRALGRVFSAHLCRQYHRAVPDGPCGVLAARGQRQSERRPAAVVNVSSIAAISDNSSSIAYQRARAR